MSEEERSEAGIPIHRHEEVAPGDLSEGDAELIEAVGAHVERHLGEPATVAR